MRRRNRYIVRGIAGTGVCLLLGAPWIRSLTVPAATHSSKSTDLASSDAPKTDLATTHPASDHAQPSHTAATALASTGAPKVVPESNTRRLPGHVALAPTAQPQEPSILATTSTPDLHTAGLGQLVASAAPQWLPGATMPGLPRLLPHDGQHALAAPRSPAVASLAMDIPTDLPESPKLGGSLIAPSPPMDLTRLFTAPPRELPDALDDTSRDPAHAQSFQATATIQATLRAVPALPLMQLNVPQPTDRGPAVQSRQLIPESDAPINLAEPPERRTIQPVR